MKQLSRSELVVEPVKPTLRYAAALTSEHMEAIQANGAVVLNLYVTSEFWIELTIYGDHDDEIDESKIIRDKPASPMQGSWFA
jgi:hypothetical protein